MTYQIEALPLEPFAPLFPLSDAVQAMPAPGVVPEMLTRRPLSIRVYDRRSMMIEGQVIDGADLDAVLRRWFEEPTVETVHIHFAPRGCYLARAVRQG